MAVELKVPEVGESITEAYIQSWTKSEGDSVKKDETVAELETEKVSFELPAPASGTLSKILKDKGETVKVGDVIGQIEEGEAWKEAEGKPEAKAEEEPEKNPQEEREAAREAETTDRKAAPASERREPKEEEEPDQRQKPAPRREETEIEVRPRIMPAARRALAEHGLSADEVEPSGPGGRLLKEDVIRHVASGDGGRAAEPEPVSPPAAEAEREEEAVAMSPMRKTIARRLVEAQQTAALLTTFNEADMSAVMQLRQKYRDHFENRYDVKLGFMSFFVKAAVDALKQFPAINAEVREEQIVYRNYYDIGIAVSTDRGLAVPVLRNAEHLSFAEIELAVNEFGQRARNNKLELKDLQGGTFTITNGGVFGSMMSTPIVNPPQSGVLGMHAIQERPVARDGQVVIRPMMYLALTYDHRIVDGREAVTFLRRIKEAVEEPTRMLLEV